MFTATAIAGAQGRRIVAHISDACSGKAIKNKTQKTIAFWKSLASEIGLSVGAAQMPVTNDAIKTIKNHRCRMKFIRPMIAQGLS